MNLITADFDWISIGFFIGASITGLIKANSRNNKKTLPSPVLEPIPVQEIAEKEYIEKETRPAQTDKTPKFFKPDISVLKEKEPEIISTEEENEEYISPIYNIRQAIISSEILRHPHF